MKPSPGWIEDPGLILFLLGWICPFLPSAFPERVLPEFHPIYLLLIPSCWTAGLVFGIRNRKTLYGKIAIALNGLSILLLAVFVVMLIIDPPLG
jgi:hypothetical protein